MENAHYETLLTQHLLEEIKDYAIFMINLQGIIVSWNKGVKTVLGYQEDEFINQPFSIIFTDEDRALHLDEAELKRAQTEGRAEDSRWHQRKDGTIFWANGIVTPVKDESGAITGFAKIMQDQTEKKKIEEDLVEQTNTLIEVNKELARFAGVVSHDLNAPLQTVYGFAHHLNDDTALTGESRDSLKHIITGTEKMMELVRELLDEAKGTNSTHLELVESGPVLKETLLGLKAAISQARAKISYADLPPVLAQPVKLKRVFQNLIQNALKYRNPLHAPEVHIGFERKEGGEIIFCVSDNGVGIKEQKDKEAVFDPFVRLENSKKVEGTGIGLAACKKIVESWKGHIWIEDNQPSGCKVFFTVPEQLTQEKAQDDEAVPQELGFDTAGAR